MEERILAIPKKLLRILPQLVLFAQKLVYGGNGDGRLRRRRSCWCWYWYCFCHNIRIVFRRIPLHQIVFGEANEWRVNRCNSILDLDRIDAAIAFMDGIEGDCLTVRCPAGMQIAAQIVVVVEPFPRAVEEPQIRRLPIEKPVDHQAPVGECVIAIAVVEQIFSVRRIAAMPVVVEKTWTDLPEPPCFHVELKNLELADSLAGHPFAARKHQRVHILPVVMRAKSEHATQIAAVFITDQCEGWERCILREDAQQQEYLRAIGVEGYVIEN